MVRVSRLRKLAGGVSQHEGGQKVFYNFLEYIIFYRTFLKKSSSPLLFSSSPPNLAHNMVASEDSMMRGNGHTNFCESCVKPVALGRLITTIFPRIYARTYYAHPRARVMSFSAREPARFPLQNPPHALRLQHMAHTLVATAQT